MNIDTNINPHAEKKDNVENYEEPETLKAEIIYVIIKKSCYVPRSLRVQWFLQHLHTKIRISPHRDLDENDSEAVIISVSPHDPPDYWTAEDSHKYEYSIELSTNAIFLGEMYRQVYCLDISPSVSTVDIQHGQVLLDVIIEALQASIKLLIKPFQIPGSSHKFTPDIFITVIAHTPFYISPAQQVLVHGWRISEDNVNEFLEAVLRQLKFIEDEVARVSGSVHEQFERDRKNSIIGNELQCSTERIFKESYEPTPTVPNIAMVSPGSSFLNLLRYGMLALKLLPASNFSNLVVITDGMIIMPDSDTLDSVLNHMRYNDIACYFLHVGSQFHPHCGFGFVPYTEIMQLISVATNGAYMQFQTQHKPVVHLNVYQQNFLTWSLKRKSVVSDLSTPHSKDGEWYISNRHFYGNRGPQLIVKKYLENDINVTLYGVLACRMREGFILKDIYIRDSQLIISFTLAWTNHIYIDYVLSCQWPLVSAPSISSHYVINIRAPYEFLHDISCRQKVPIKSPFRQALIARFWRSLKSFAQSDLLLSHLESFMNSNSSYYLPESLKNGMPLYNLLPGCNQPTISSSDIGYTQFGNIWRPVCLLNNNLWQKWFHADRVGVIFKHDDPLNLFTQKFESRIIKYSSTGLQCRQATNTLFNFLKTYCSFVLIENHSYIKFLLPNESGTGKHSFLVIRSIVKPPYAVLHIAFLYNIPGRVRSNLLEDFKRSVVNLKIPRLPATNDNYNNIFGPEPYDAHANCCVLLDKPLEKILIRYEQIPKEFRTVVFPDGTQPSPKASNALSSNRGLITTLSRYLHHRRWIWKTNVGQSVFLPFGAVEKVLSTLIRKRLQEGFYFAHYCAGICNMVLEVQMKGARIEKEDVDGIYYEYQNGAEDNERLQSCIIQYVVFSPKTFISDNDGEDNNANVKVVELVTECWIEPQHGVITDCPPVRNYMSNLQYHQLPDAIWATDAKCISALFTFQYLRLMCEESNVKVPESVQYLLNEPNSTRYWPNVAPFEDERIRQIPFAYSLPNLLCQCTQEMMQFNLFSVDVSDKTELSVACNRLLLESVYNHLSVVHTKELLICGQEAQYLIRNLRKTSNERSCFYDSEVPSHTDFVSAYDWDRMTSCALDEKRKSSSTPRSSRTFTSVDTKMSKPSDIGSHQSSSFDISLVSNLENAEWLKWKCFVKFTSRNQCLVTIIPDSLEVIKRIMLSAEKDTVLSGNQSQDAESSATDPNEMSVSATATRNDSFYTACSSSSKELPDDGDELVDRTPKETFRLRASTWDPVRGLLETPADIDDRLRTNSVGARVRPLLRLRAKRSFDLDSTEKSSENGTPPNYVPLILPLYVCNCTLDDVIVYLIGKSEEKGRASQYVVENENNLEEQCRSITVAFRKYFILSLFKCLLQGYDIPVTDVNQAFNKCEMSVVTIDITEYLKVVCRHLKNLISTNAQETDENDLKPSSYFTSSNVCNELRCIHCLIRKKFNNILTLDFKPIPSKPEFYYFSPSWSKESKPSSVGMLSPGLMENPLTNISVEQIIPPVSVANVSALNAWETCKESVNSDEHAACTSLLSNMDSDSLNEASNESLADESNPFFIRIDCKISSENSTGKCSLNVIPTCICDILNLLDKPLDINVADLRVTLDLSCLTSSYVDAKKKTSKNIQTNGLPKTEELDRGYVYDSVLDNGSFEDSKIPKQLENLPDYQYNALNTFLTQIKWLMKDEIVTFMLDTNPVTWETLKRVCEHVESSPNAGTCFIEKVPLSFVFDQEKTSINNFLQDFDYMKVSNYRLKKLGNMYYLIKNSNEKHRSLSRRDYVDDYSDLSDMCKIMTSSMEKVNEEQEHFSQVFSSNESICENDRGRNVCIEYVNTRLGSITDPDDEISRGIQSTVQWILDREMSEVELPNFWLIMTITEDYVTVYFHCRFLEFKNKKIDDYVMIRENVIQKIKDMCKVVNQKMLLDNLHDTRICDQLLVPDPQQSEEDDMLISLMQSNNAFTPGCFACPVVWETKFILHPRLKVSHLKGAVSRGIQALCSILSGFSVNNRKNLFVYQDNNKNVFYLRLYESIHGSSKHDSEETTSSGSFSRSSSFTSLSRKQFDEQLPFLLDETRSRNKSFSDASESNLLRSDDYITLKVYGISEAGKDVKSELVQLLQNKLDDAVLDVISVMLSRNPLCKLLSEDVHFIQKPNQLPNDIVQFSVHNRVVDHLYTLRQLIRQNVQTFAYLPKYSDPRSSFHFQDYSVAEDSPKRINEQDIFMYNQSPPCGKAIACFALALVDYDGEIIECEEKSRTPVHVESQFWPLDEIKRMTSTEAVNEGNVHNSHVRVELRIWKQGKLNMEVFNSKFLLAIRHALWELVIEKYLLPYAVFFPNTDNLCEVYYSLMPLWMNFGTELNVPSVREWETMLPIRSNVNLIFRELNSMFLPHETACYGFYKSRNSCYRPCVTFDDKVQHKGETCLLVGLNLTHPQCGNEYPRGISLDMRGDARLQRSPSSSQEDGQFVITKRKFILAVIADSKIKLYLYNCTKEKIEMITKEMTSFSEWLRMRSHLLFSIVEQKMGLFFNAPIQRADSSQKNIDVNNTSIETLLRFPLSSKPVSGIHLNSVADAFKDVKLPESIRKKTVNQNPFLHHVNQLREILKVDRKAQYKHLHNVWQRKASSSNTTSVNEEMLNNFLLQGRLIHFVLTPLLFMPRWRLKTAATRDHSLSLKTQNQSDDLIQQEGDESWHASLCSNFIHEYKQYLHSLGFHVIQRYSENFPTLGNLKHPLNDVVSNVHYMQKYLLGGVLLYELYFSEPFFNTKLYALEYARLNNKTSSLVSQFTVSFLDECDRIKFQMHLHSFTYDYHLRCLHLFITEQQPLLGYGYHIVNFLDDFIKYYPKAPNFARNLVQTEFVTVNDVSISPSQLFDYLLTHRKNYNMAAFAMTPEFALSDSIEEHEYVLVKNKSTSAVCYKDVNNQQQTDDFDIIIIISHTSDVQENNIMKFQIYVVITSRRELYPKVESDQKIGKFRTVSTSYDYSSSNEDDTDTRLSVCEDSGSSKDSSLELKEPRRKRATHHVEIKLEPINYLGYYSSHEEAMQKLMLDEIEEAKKYIQWMVTQGTFDCKTHILWKQLLCSSPTPLNYEEFQNLLSMADVYEISSMDDQLKAILNQPISWLSSFIKALDAKQPDHCHLFSAPSGNTQEFLILHPQYTNGFMLIVLNILTNTCTMSLVYRRGLSDGEEAQSILQTLFEQIINNLCFHLWIDAF